MMHISVKICGITNQEDLLSACNAGADAIGFVFYAPSQRYIAPVDAAELCKKLPPLVKSVGLFVDATEAEVNSVLDQVPLDILQFHGEESGQFCQSFSRPYFKATAMKPGLDVQRVIDEHPHAQGFLWDAFKQGVPGGTGETFNWDRFPKASQSFHILAGGLDPDNVQQAILASKPYAVDVSGGVESKPGKKSVDKIRAFISNAKHSNIFNVNE